MIRTILESGFFLCAALVVHLSFWWAVPAGDPGSAGEGGDATISLAAIPPTIAAMLNAVDTPPAVMVELDAGAAAIVSPTLPHNLPRTAPKPVTQPGRAPTVQPDMAEITVPGLSLPPSLPPRPVEEHMPQDPIAEAPLEPMDPTPPPPEDPPNPVVSAAKQATADTPNPQQRPKRTSTPSEQAAQKSAAPAQSAGQSAQRAKGDGLSKQAGAGQSDTGSLSPAKRASLLQTWGNKIRARIERRKSMPRGINTSGTATVRVAVTSDGRLASLELARSSGVQALDAAALNAVKRVGRFAKAPKALGFGPHYFILPIQISR